MADLLRAKWLLAVLVVAGVLIWLGAARALTPTTLTVLTGAEGSTSHADALRYQTLLEQRGVRTTVEPTNGSVENLQRLVREGGNQIAFAEVGLERAVDEPERESAGSKIPFAPLRGPYFEMRQNLHDVRARVEERR